MKNKILVRLVIPEISREFDVFLPVNEYIWKIKKMCIKSIGDIVGIPVDLKKDYLLFNKASGEMLQNNQTLIETNIRNGEELVLFSNY